MPDKDFFIGILTNVDKSLSNFNLGYGFSIKRKPYAVMVRYVRKLSDGYLFADKRETRNWLFTDYPYSPPGKDTLIYFIVNEGLEEFDDPEMEGCEPLYNGNKDCFSGIEEFQFSYIQPILRLMRLFKESDIRMISYAASRNGSFSYGPYSGTHHQKNVLNVNIKERKELYDFIRNNKIPFQKDFLQLAFENFEISYDIRNLSLSFLMPMISMETLFDNGQSDLEHDIPHFLATLLQKDKYQYSLIYNDIVDLYQKKSRLVRDCKLVRISYKDAIKARSYARNSIKEILKLNMTKRELHNYLSSF